MTVTVSWYDERQTGIVVTILEYQPTWEGLTRSIDDSHALAKTVTHDVIIIVNPQDFPMPKKQPPIPHLRRVMADLPPNVKWVVIILSNPGYFEQSIVNILVTIVFRNRLKVVKTLDDAYRVLPGG